MGIGCIPFLLNLFLNQIEMNECYMQKREFERILMAEEEVIILTGLKMG